MIGPWKQPEQRAQGQLRRLHDEDADPFAAARLWARDVLREFRIDAGTRPMAAARALRHADPRLGRVTARYLVELAAGRKDGSEPPRRRSPLLH